MERLFRKVPVEGDFFIPFMELTEILSHEEKFLARMSEHESVADFQVGKFILVFARHFVDHRAFEVDDLVVREHQNEVFAGAVGDAEGHFVVVKFTEIRVELHVFEEVMHPAHIPFEGKSKTVLVFAQGDKEKEALAAGADYVGADDLVEKIKGGWLEFDVAIATPNMMGKVGRLGKILGPKGLMPNPKVGTVTMDVTKAVSESKAGKVEYRTDKAGNIHSSIGKKSFEADKLIDNLTALVDTLIKVKPSGAKGQYIKSITVSSTMGPGIHINQYSIKGAAKKEEN